MRHDCSPYLVSQDGSQRSLKRIRFDDKAIAESYLQKVIHKAPNILPVERFVTC